MKKQVVLFLGWMFMGCSGEDACFSKQGDEVLQTHQLQGFHTIDIPMNVSVDIVQHPEFKMDIHSFENRIDAISFAIKDSVLVIQNDISCEMLKSYETATLKIYSPHLKAIHSRTQFKVFSSDTLRYPNLYLLTSIPNQSSASTNFDLKVNNKKLFIEDNQVGYFQISGKTNLLNIQLYGGNGVVDATNLKANVVQTFHRSNQNIHVWAKNKIEATIASIGNIYIYSKPDTIKVETLYKGNLIFK